LVALARISTVKVLRAIAATFVSLIRGTPLLLQLFIIFYGLPSLGIVLDPWPSAIVAFSLNVGGYAAETIRAAILSVPKGQWEAAATVGLSRAATLRQIVLPQAARVAVPPLSNTLISLVKDTSLASAVLVTEILRKAQELAAPTFQFFLLYGIAAIYYWIVSQLLTVLQGRLEKRLNRKVAR
jgi:cystine transport system permease protein